MKQMLLFLSLHTSRMAYAAVVFKNESIIWQSCCCCVSLSESTPAPYGIFCICGGWMDGWMSLADFLFSLAESLMQRHKNKAVCVHESTHRSGQSWYSEGNVRCCIQPSCLFPLKHDKQLLLQSNSAAYTSSPWGSCRKTVKEQKLHQHVWLELKWHFDDLSSSLPCLGTPQSMLNSLNE